MFRSQVPAMYTPGGGGGGEGGGGSHIARMRLFVVEISKISEEQPHTFYMGIPPDVHRAFQQ